MKNTDRKILIVDDNPKNIQVLAKLLSDNDYNIETAISGAEALHWIDEDEFDLILLDIMMPEMDGFEVCEKIKQQKKNKDLPIIFLTAKTDVESVTKAFLKGGYDYLTKPFNSDELLARVKTHVELRKSKEQLKKVNQWLEEKVTERTRELKESNEELAKAKEELEELDLAKNEFLRLINHEIRTPLNGILGGLMIIKDYELPGEINDFIEMLDLSTQRLERFSYKALDISALRTIGKEGLGLKSCNLYGMLNDIKNDLTGQLAAKNINLIMNNSLKDIKIFVNRELVMNSLEYIIENAIRFSDQDSGIEINSTEHDNTVIIDIKDEGAGFSEYALKNLFKPFSNTKHHTDENMGLSLYYAKLVMDAHEGSISIEPNQPKGSIVKLSVLSATQ